MLEKFALFAGEFFRDLHVQVHEQIAAGAAIENRHAQVRMRNCAPGWVPSGTRICWVPSNVSISISAPSTACAKLMGSVQCKSFSRRSKMWCSFTLSTTYKSPGCARRARGSICLIFIISAVISFTGCTTVGPGNVGIKINQTGDNRGVDQLPLETGWVTYNIFTQKVFEYPIFVQTVIWTADTKEGAPADESITFNSKEGMVINGDISLSYQLTAEKVPAFYVKFRSDDLKAFTYGFLHNVARDAFNEIGPTFSVEEIYGPSKEFLLKKVVERINSQTKQYGVEIVQFGFTGALRLPPSVIDALNGKIAATQTAMRVHNEVMTAQAEAEKTIATAKGQAEANRILAQSISPQLIQWRNLAITEQWINKWNGQKAQVELGGDNKPLIQIPVPGK